MSILNVNVRSLRKNLLNLEAFIYSLDVQPDVICLTETWLSETDEISNYLVTRYNGFVATNRGSKGVESCCYVTNFAILQRKVRSTFRKLFV